MIREAGFVTEIYGRLIYNNIKKDTETEDENIECDCG